MRHIITVATEGEADAVTVFAHLNERGCTARVALYFKSGGDVIAVESIGAADFPEIAEVNINGAWDLSVLAMLLDEFDTEIEKVPATETLALEFSGAESSALSRLSL